MTAVFSEQEKRDAFKEKRKLWTLWFIALGVYLLLEAIMITINVVLIVTARDRAVYMPFMIISIVLCVIFGFGSMFFFSIKFRLTSKYCRMFREMKAGLKDRTHGKFVGIETNIVEKDGVFFYSLVLDCPPLRRGDITTRKVLVERNHSLPPFEVGEKIEFITHANILMAYERVDLKDKNQ